MSHHYEEHEHRSFDVIYDDEERLYHVLKRLDAAVASLERRVSEQGETIGALYQALKDAEEKNASLFALSDKRNDTAKERLAALEEWQANPRGRRFAFIDEQHEALKQRVGTLEEKAQRARESTEEAHNVLLNHEERLTEYEERINDQQKAQGGDLKWQIMRLHDATISALQGEPIEAADRSGTRPEPSGDVPPTGTPLTPGQSGAAATSREGERKPRGVCVGCRHARTDGRCGLAPEMWANALACSACKPAPSASEAECSHSSAVADSKRGWVCDYCRKELGFTLSGVPCPPEPTPQASDAVALLHKRYRDPGPESRAEVSAEDAAERETAIEVARSDHVEDYLRSIHHPDSTLTDRERLLIDGNVRGFAGWLRDNPFPVEAPPQASEEADEAGAERLLIEVMGATTDPSAIMDWVRAHAGIVREHDRRIASEAREKAIEEAAVLVEAHPAVFYPDGAHDVARAIRALSPSTSKAEATKEASMPQAGESPVPSRRSEPAGGISPSTSEEGEVKP